MNTAENATTKLSNGAGQKVDEGNANSEKNALTKSTPDSANGTEKTLTRRESRTLAAYVGRPILVSEAQFNAVKEAHLQSMNLLDSSGEVLLRALDSMVPPEGSGRTIGEYTAQGMRQLAKSVCDLVQTKTQVVRSMHQIARDEL